MLITSPLVDNNIRKCATLEMQCSLWLRKVSIVFYIHIIFFITALIKLFSKIKCESSDNCSFMSFILYKDVYQTDILYSMIRIPS